MRLGLGSDSFSPNYCFIKTRRAGNSLRKRTSASSVYDLITIWYAHLGGFVKESIETPAAGRRRRPSCKFSGTKERQKFPGQKLGWGYQKGRLWMLTATEPHNSSARHIPRAARDTPAKPIRWHLDRLHGKYFHTGERPGGIFPESASRLSTSGGHSVPGSTSNRQHLTHSRCRIAGALQR